MSHPAYIYPAFLHMEYLECKILVLLPSQAVTPLSPGRGGARGGRRVCGMSVWARERYAMSALRLFHNIEG